MQRDINALRVYATQSSISDGQLESLFIMLSNLFIRIYKSSLSIHPEPTDVKLPMVCTRSFNYTDCEGVSIS